MAAGRAAGEAAAGSSATLAASGVSLRASSMPAGEAAAGAEAADGSASQPASRSAADPAWPSEPAPSAAAKADAAFVSEPAADSASTSASASAAASASGSASADASGSASDSGSASAAASASASASASARATLAHHSRTFSLASKLLPSDRRDDAAVLYAYCRRVDDAVDDAPSPEAARAALGALRAELDVLYAAPSSTSSSASSTSPSPASPPGAPLADPVLARLAAIVAARRLPRLYPEALLDGMAMDVSATRYHTVDDLLAYAYRVAGVVGLMMCHVLGLSDERAVVPAAHLGIAMQLTNICRDVAEDWQRGRLYLPASLLARHGAAPDLADRAAAGEPLPADACPALAATTRELLALADRYYRSADRGMRALAFRPAFGIRAARYLYAAIGPRILARGADPRAGRAFVPGWRKLALVGRAALGNLLSLPTRLRQRGTRQPLFAPPTITLELGHAIRL